MTGSEMRAKDQPLLADRRLALWIVLVMWAIAGLISLAMAIQGSADWIQSIDDRVYTLVVENEVGAFVWLGELLGVFGSVVVMAPLMIGVAVFLGVRHRWSALTVWVSTIAVSQLVSITMKNLYGRPRPPLPLVETTSFSFPSGHAITGAVFAIGVLIVLVPSVRRLPLYWIIALIYVIAMAWGRVYVRAHWLSDVTAGVAIGTAVVLTVALLIVWLDDRPISRSSVEESQS
ncbi:MAG: phosphatase PAP2 family protein [Actinomycetia bacterium]|nr:phosphatase PAP2 family protein [Actinomycetes bacterium]